MSQISVTDLTFSYDGSADEVFDHVSFSVDTDWKPGCEQWRIICELGLPGGERRGTVPSLWDAQSRRADKGYAGSAFFSVKMIFCLLTNLQIIWIRLHETACRTIWPAKKGSYLYPTSGRFSMPAQTIFWC